MEDKGQPLMGGGVKILVVTQGSGFLLLGCWSGRKGGLVDPFEGARLQKNMGYFNNNVIKKLPCMNVIMNAK